MTHRRSPILHDKPGQSPSNRSLERGIEILRAFRPGSELLGNGDLVERTGLSKATVSRLTQTLVGCGMLQAASPNRGSNIIIFFIALSLCHGVIDGTNYNYQASTI